MVMNIAKSQLAQKLMGGKSSHVRDAFQGMQQRGGAAPQQAPGRITLDAEYDASADAVVALGSVELTEADVCVSVFTQALLSPEGELLDVSFQLFDEQKHNTDACGMHVNIGYIDRFMGKALTVVAAAQAIALDGTTFDFYVEKLVRIERSSP